MTLFVQHEFFMVLSSMSLTLWKALVPTSTKHPSVAVLQNMLFPKSHYLNVYKCGGACRQHAVYEDQMLSQSRKENVAIQSHHCLLHFVFSVHGNLALQRFVYPSMYVQYTICSMHVCRGYVCLFPLILWLQVYFEGCVCITLKKNLSNLF